MWKLIRGIRQQPVKVFDVISVSVFVPVTSFSLNLVFFHLFIKTLGKDLVVTLKIRFGAAPKFLSFGLSSEIVGLGLGPKILGLGLIIMF